jgi:hypothetical protein
VPRARCPQVARHTTPLCVRVLGAGQTVGTREAICTRIYISQRVFYNQESSSCRTWGLDPNLSHSSTYACCVGTRKRRNLRSNLVDAKSLQGRGWHLPCHIHTCRTVSVVCRVEKLSVTFLYIIYTHLKCHIHKANQHREARALCPAVLCSLVGQIVNCSVIQRRYV